MDRLAELKFIDFDGKNNNMKYLLNNEEKTINLKSDDLNIVNKLNYLLEVLDGKYALIVGVKALIKDNKLGIKYTKEEIELIEKIIDENNLESEKLVLYKLPNKRYSKDLVGTIDSSEKVEFLIDIGLDKFNYDLRKALSLYKGNEVRVKKYFKMCKDINYSEIDKTGQTPKANIILAEILYKNLNSNFIESIMNKNGVNEEDFYVRLYTLTTLYCRLNMLDVFSNIDKINYEITSSVHEKLIRLFNKENIKIILDLAIRDSEYIYTK